MPRYLFALLLLQSSDHGPLVVTPPVGYACVVYQFAERTDSLYFQVDCGRRR